MSEKTKKQKVWDLAKTVRGEDPAHIRQDPYGNRIQYDQHGMETPRGWQIDHIKPASKGGGDGIRNLQAMQTAKNQELGDTQKKKSRHSKSNR